MKKNIAELEKKISSMAIVENNAEEDNKIVEEITKESLLDIQNLERYYGHYALNTVIEARITNHQETMLIELGENRNLINNLQQFQNGGLFNKNRSESILT